MPLVVPHIIADMMQLLGCEGSPGQGWGMQQNPFEFAQFVTFCQRHNVKTFLELGTAKGGLARFCAEYLGWLVTAVDLNVPEFHPIEGVEFIRANVATAAYLPELKGRTFDAVLLDADKSHHGLIRDHATYAPMCRIVAIHDIAPGRPCCTEAANWWNDFCKTADVWQHQAIANHNPIGIGWYMKDER